MTSPSVRHDEIVALEQELLTTTCRTNIQRIDALLHRDFSEHGASGRIWTRAEVLETLPSSPDVDGMAVDFISRDLAPGVALLTYRIEGRRPSTRSSLWIFDDGRWQMLFHQGTLTATS